MTMENPKTTAKIAAHPIHPMLVPFPIAFFVGAFACDLAYWRAGDAFFTSVALWLIGAGLIMAAFAAVAGLIDFLGERRIRQLGDAWQHMIGNILVVVLELFNFLLRYRDPVEAVVPTGLVLSLVVTLMLLLTGWKGGEMVYRRRVGVADD